MSEVVSDQVLSQWAFNVRLEIMGRRELEVPIGGALLSLEDLDKILTKEMETRGLLEREAMQEIE